MNEHLDRLLQGAARSPLTHPWGYFFACDGAPVAGGIRACFCWFESREVMLAFIRRSQLRVCAIAVGKDRKAATELLRLACHFTQGGKFDSEEGRREVNRSLEGIAHVKWWGRFPELARGDAEFPRQIRQWYRSVFLQQPHDSSPIPAEGWEDFAPALREYRP